jgi:hypothetical protein
MIDEFIHFFENKLHRYGHEYFRSLMISRKEFSDHKDNNKLMEAYTQMIYKLLSYLKSREIEISRLAYESEDLESVFIERYFPNLDQDTISLRRRSLTRKWVEELVQEYLNENFHKKYSTLWELSLYQKGALWSIFLESNESKLKRQKSLFRYYWTLYNSYVTTRFIAVNDESFKIRSELTTGDHLVDFFEPWLLSKCHSSRIKITTNLTEKEVVNIISKGWNEFLTISSIENFVNTNFAYRNSEHSLKSYPYTIAIKKPASKFLTYLKERDLILRHKKFREKRDDLFNKPVEIQLWLEFIFKGHRGFTQNSIEQYYLPHRDEK